MVTHTHKKKKNNINFAFKLQNYLKRLLYKNKHSKFAGGHRKITTKTKNKKNDESQQFT